MGLIVSTLPVMVLTNSVNLLLPPLLLPRLLPQLQSPHLRKYLLGHQQKLQLELQPETRHHSIVVHGEVMSVVNLNIVMQVRIIAKVLVAEAGSTLMHPHQPHPVVAHGIRYRVSSLTTHGVNKSPTVWVVVMGIGLMFNSYQAFYGSLRSCQLCV